MPTPTVVATLPFSAAATKKKPARNPSPGEPAILSFADATMRRATPPTSGVGDADLLAEATNLARDLGCDVRRRCLGGTGGGYRWQGGRLRIVLDIDCEPIDRLAMVADALRGEPRLAWAEMSDELAAYLQPRRAA